MFDFLRPRVNEFTPQQSARSFRWLGWLGLWLQTLLGFIPLLVVVTTVLFGSGQQRGSRFSLGLWLAIAALVILLFSIYWCFRYTRLANQLERSDQRPAKAAIQRTLKIGLLTNLGSMTAAVLVALLRVGELTFKMLTLPQGATVIAPNQSGSMVAQGAVITASNMIAIQAMISAIAASLVGILVALLLIYQVSRYRSSSI